MPLFAPRASAPWVRGRELGFETWERTNTDIYKNGICPKIYTVGFSGLKILHHQVHLSLTVSVGKHKKCVKMEKLTLLAKVLHLTEWIFLPTNLLKVQRLIHDRVAGEW